MTIRFVSVAICLIASPITAPLANQPDVTGEWLMTLSFATAKPLITVVTFLDTDALRQEHAGEGQWERIAVNKFRIAFRLPAQDTRKSPGTEYFVTGFVNLDRSGRLHGALEAEILDSTGASVGAIRGVARAHRISSVASGSTVHHGLEATCSRRFDR